MKTLKCEILVVGGGPAGGCAAKSCAEKGLDTILIEKKAEVGAPLRCAEGASKKMFQEIGIEPKPEWIRADMKGAVIKSPDGTSFVLVCICAGSLCICASVGIVVYSLLQLIVVHLVAVLTFGFLAISFHHLINSQTLRFDSLVCSLDSL